MTISGVSVTREGLRRYVVRKQDQTLRFKRKRAAEDFAEELRQGRACILSFEPVVIWP